LIALGRKGAAKSSNTWFAYEVLGFQAGGLITPARLIHGCAGDRFGKRDESVTPLSLSLIKGLFAIREWQMNLEMKLKPGANSSVAN